MKITSKAYGDELEILKMKGSEGFTITVEVFMVPEIWTLINVNLLISKMGI